jgi:hypothetical protein
MRKVLFKKWIPREIEKAGIYPFDRTLKGTACWEEGFLHEGIFHQWASAYEEFESGAGNYTIALIELPDGTMEEVLPTNIKFID